MNIVHFPDALPRFVAARAAGIVVRGSWGEGPDVSVCMMSAEFLGAKSDRECALQGCPEWLSTVTRYLFDQDVGAKNEDEAAFDWSEAVFGAMMTPFDADAALDRFLIRRLADGNYSILASMRINAVDADWWRDCEAAIIDIADVLRRKLSGEDVHQAQMDAARAADDIADVACVSARFAARAAYVAADVVDAADAAAGAAYVAADFAFAAASAAFTAAREDLIAAIIESQIGESA